MENNSDYKLPFTDLYSFLPTVFQKDVNKYISANVFNRYLSKDESKYTFGSIGQRNTTSLEITSSGDYVYHDTRLPELTVLRQAWQLQPVLYTKLATVEAILSWENVKTELMNTQVDIARVPVWGNALQFNWAPPIDPDKLANYTNYYWYDPIGRSDPDYITIKSICQVYTARYNELNNYINEQLITPTITPAELAAYIVQLNALAVLKDCSCNSGGLGWDTTQWDDNPFDWWTQVGNIGIPSDPTNVNGGAIPGGGWTTANPPPGPRVGFPEDTPYWWDSTANAGDGQLNIWEPLSSTWILALQNPGLGSFPWDFTIICVPQLDPWSQTNYWYHRLDVPDVNGAVQARRPIIEYNPYLELNAWTYANPNWLYRINSVSPWISSSTQPTIEEMSLRYPVIGVDFFLNTITIAGDHTLTFVPGFQFSTEDEFNNVSYWTTVGSTLNIVNTVIQIQEMPITISGIDTAIRGGTFNIVYIEGDRTGELTAGDTITIKDSTTGSGVLNGTYTVSSFFYNAISIPDRTEITIIGSFPIVPVDFDGKVVHSDSLAPFVTSSRGDQYIGFLNQWVLSSINTPVPVNTQSLNPTPDFAMYETVPGGVNTFILTTLPSLPSNAISPDAPIIPAASAQYMAHTDTIRVYIDGERSYGTYEEGIWDSGTSTFTVADDSTLYCNAIQFLSTVDAFSSVRIEISPAASIDEGYDGMNHGGINVRTTTSYPFTPELMNLIRYRRVEQIKTSQNQYPLFDLFNIDGTTAYLANPLFVYVEDSTYPIDQYLNKRIVVLEQDRNFLFEQLMLTPTGGIYCYKDIDSIEISNTEGLQTIWRKGLNNEQYVPDFVNQYRLTNGETYTDWNGNTQTATVDATNGTWNLPNQMFFNPMHENRAQVKYSDIYTHYNSIVTEQVPPTDFPFVTQDSFRLLFEMNYGLGGTIREYNDSYDTFLSAIYDNTSNPQAIIEFAASQYVNLLDSIKELFLKNITSYLINTSPIFVTDLEISIISSLIDAYEANEFTNIVYGDTTAYDPTTNIGMKNWIATIPVMNLNYRQVPFRLVDPDLDLDKLRHHDGHLATYTISNSVTQAIYANVLELTGGVKSPIQPTYTQVSPGLYWQNSITRQLFRFTAIAVGPPPSPPINSPIGSYWFNTTTNTLFFRDATNMLTGWSEVYATDPFKVGKIDAAWEEIIFENILTDTIKTIENNLYSISSDSTTSAELAFDYQTQLLFNPAQTIIFQEYMKQEYYNFIQTNNLNPFATDFLSTDAFTWNYKQVSTSIVVYPTTASNSNKPWAPRYIDIYSKIFGTSYPHLEPWVLQGYPSEPSWWSTTYVDVEQVETFTNADVLTGPFSTITIPANTLDYWVTGMPVVFNVVSGTAPSPLVNGTTYYIIRTNSTSVRFATTLNNALNNIFIVITAVGLGNFEFTYTPFIPRRWSPGMWANVKAGVVPVGELLPDGVTISTGAAAETTVYSHVCVNIYSSIIDGYDPDDLIPPYYGNDPSLILQALVRNIAFIPLGSISDSYEFGDNGPTEQQWRESAEFKYDILKVSYRMQPVRFLHYSWGENFTTVAGLQVDTRTSKVYAHQDTVFHGDLVGDTTYQLNGVNQWYINFIRYGSYDINLSYFKPKWTGWTPLLSYLTSSMIDASSIKLSNKYFPVPKANYLVTLKRSYGVESFAIDDLKVTVEIPGTYTVYSNSKIPDGAGEDWVFNISIPSPVARALPAFGMKKYAITITNPTTFTLVTGTLPLYNSADPNPNMTWATGTLLFIESTVSLPSPYLPNTEYFLIVVNSTTFKLADSYNNAIAGISITSTTSGSGTIYIEQVKQSFRASHGAVTPVVWRQFEVDTRIIYETLSPFLITGVQNLLDFIYGYADFARSIGFVFNDPSLSEINKKTQQLVSWQFEIEQMIDTIYTGLGTSTIAVLEPELGIPDVPLVEVSPFKNAIWFKPDRGIVSNVISGPFSDIRTSPSVYDQNGKPLPQKSVVALREDKKTRVYLPTPVGSNYEVNGEQTFGVSLENNNHIGGIKLFVDEYENIIIFNDYTDKGDLIYDPFLGLSVGKFTISFERVSDYTFRPNAGGYFLSGNDLIQNIEAAVGTLPLFYDTYVVNEQAPYVKYARAAVGYQNPAYLDQLQQVTEKSKFLFWKGLIQNKGTINAVKAFTNARLFLGAEVDEFWAYKLAEYGDSRTKITPELKLFTTDVTRNQIRFQFTSPGDPLESTFTEVTLADRNRWFNQPDQVEAISENSRNGNFYFDARTIAKESKPNFIIHDSNYYIRLNIPVDDVNFTFSNGTGQITSISTSFSANVPVSFLTTFNFIVGARNIDVYFIDQSILPASITLLTPGVDYIETSNNTVEVTFTSNKFGQILIEKRVGLLINNVHYEFINSRILKMLFTPNNTPGSEYNLLDYTVYLLNVNKYSSSPITLIDYLAGTILDKIQLWHPAIGLQYSESLQAIDLVRDSDPALYSNNLDTNISTYSPLNLWNELEVGTTWLDTSNLGYIPYYDKKVFDLNTRIYYWGSLADWASINLYQWVESNVLPSEWDELVAADANDPSLINEEKHTGTPLKRLYVRYLNTLTNVWGPWTELDNAYFQEYDMVLVGPTQTLIITDFDVAVGDVVNVYINGFFIEEATVQQTVDVTPIPDSIIKTVTVTTTLNPQDTVRIIKPLPVFTEDQQFAQATSSSTNVQYQNDYPYSTINIVNNQGIIVSTKYYFWVQGVQTISDDRDLSIAEAASQMKKIPVPYMFFQNFKNFSGPEPLVDTLDRTSEYLNPTPGFYSEIIINGIGNNIIQENDRYKLRFVKDLTLRDILVDGIDLKIKHEEWGMIRQNQTDVIPRDLWDKITESIVGYKLADPTIPVPSVDREFYDNQYGTSTRWGLGNEQAFVDGALAVNTITKEILDESFDISPIDRDIFFEIYFFDRPENIIDAMNTIYTSFPAKTVNRIWFSVLMDALTLQHQMKGIFKTSYLALHGIRLLETAQKALDD